MKNKLKLTPTMLCALMAVSSFSIANATDAWSESKVSSYVAGTQVTDSGKTYQCKEWPASGWCQNAAYKPSGMYGADAWDVVGDEPGPGPEPTPVDPTSTDWDPNKTYVKGDTVTYNGESYTAKWWTQGDTPKKDADGNPWQYNGEASQGKGTVSIVLPAKPDFITNGQLADVQILKGDKVVAEVNNANWGSTKNIEVEVGDSSDLTVNVPAIDGATGSANPAAFTLKENGSQTVNVEYTAVSPAEQGSITINAKADITSNATTSYSLADSKGNVVASGKLEINKPTTLEKIPASEEGTNYTLTVGSFVNGGFNYTPTGTYPVTVTSFNTSNVDVAFTKQAIPTEKVYIMVSDLPEDKSTTLTLSNKNGESKEMKIDSNSTTSVDVPKDNTVWNISVDAIPGFKTNVSPASFTANSKEQNINVSFEENSSDSKWPDRVVVGYVKGYDSVWYSQPDTTNQMVSDAMDHGYNVLVYAFAGQSKAGDVFFTSWTNQQIKDLPNQIQTIHDKYGIALLSIGGAENYFEPDMTTDAKAESTGKAMGKFLADNNFDGLDIDVEHPTNGADEDENFLKYIEAARAEFKSITGRDMFLTAAPQVTGWYGTGPWASGEAHFAESTYSQNFMDNAHFDAIFVQTYNQYAGAKLCGLVGTETGFLSCAFKLLTEEGQKDMPGISSSWHVPAETKLVLGVPDFKDPSVSPEAYRQGSCLADASCSGAGIYDPAEYTKDVTEGQLSSYNQYGGSMTWIMNSDAYQDWTWVDGVKNASYN